MHKPVYASLPKNKVGNTWIKLLLINIACFLTIKAINLKYTRYYQSNKTIIKTKENEIKDKNKYLTQNLLELDFYLSPKSIYKTKNLEG